MSTNATKEPKPTRDRKAVGVVQRAEFKIRFRLCAHCGERFAVNPRLGRRHRFCTQPACALASRRAAQRKWLKKNGGKAFFSGKENLERVRNWRHSHPGYWKKAGRRQDLELPAFALSDDLATVLRYVALQDTIDTRLALEIGIISRLSGAGLQDTIAKEIRKTMMRGYAILSGQPIGRSK